MKGIDQTTCATIKMFGGRPRLLPPTAASVRSLIVGVALALPLLSLGCGTEDPPAPKQDPHTTGVITDGTSSKPVAGAIVEITEQVCTKYLDETKVVCLNTEFKTYATSEPSGADGKYQFLAPLDHMCNMLRIRHTAYAGGDPKPRCDQKLNSFDKVDFVLKRLVPTKPAVGVETIASQVTFAFGIGPGFTLLITRRAKDAVVTPPESEKSYLVGDSLGAATVVCVVAGSSCPATGPCTCIDATAVEGTPYTYAGYLANTIPLYSEPVMLDHTP